MAFDFITLENGLRVIGERIPSFRSVAVGLWVGAGSKYEAGANNGMSHFIEHMVFKGTKNRTAKELAEQMDEVGGYLNAFTANDCTCFYTKVVGSDIKLAIDMISDMAVNPRFDTSDMEKEKGVVIEEIDMVEDSPEDLSHELLLKAHFGNQGISLPILGTRKTVGAFTREMVMDYWTRMYRPENCVFSVAGCYDWNEVLDIVNEYFGPWEKGDFVKPEYRFIETKPEFLTKTKDIEQAHLSIGLNGLSQDDEYSPEYNIFTSVLGGANSSRLFQKIREDSGLAYQVYATPNFYKECGMLEIYAATGIENVEKVYDMILTENEKLANEGITQTEFDKMKKQIYCSLVMGDESTSQRMSSLGKRMLIKGNTRTLDEILELYEKADIDSTNALAKKLLTQEHSRVIVARKDAVKRLKSDKK